MYFFIEILVGLINLGFRRLLVVMCRIDYLGVRMEVRSYLRDYFESLGKV